MTYDPNRDDPRKPNTLSGSTMLLVLLGAMIVAGLVVSTWGEWSRNDPATAIVEKNSTTTGQSTK